MSELLAGGIKARYRKSCGMCKHRVALRSSSYCNKAFELDGNTGSLYEARSLAIGIVEFNTKYSVAANMVCDEYFEPVSTRFPLD